MEMEEEHDHSESKETELYDGTGGDMNSEGDVRKARGILIPSGPSPAARREHELTHMPYRSWCQSCVAGRGKESPHQQRRKDPSTTWPVVQADYVFMHTDGDKGDKVTIMTITETATGATVATPCPKKGHDPFVEKVVKHGIDSFARNSDLLLQGDGELGVLDLL